MNHPKRLAIIEQRLRETMHPLRLTIIDDSEQHRGHAGAKDGRGHYTIKITAQAFNGKSLAECHRLVYSALNDMMNTDIHALRIETKPVTTPDITELVTDTLSAHKALDMTAIDVSAMTTVMDTMVICTATSTRHAASLADKLITAAKKAGIRPVNRDIEAQTETGWVLVDLLHVVVHIMLADIRAFYNLEKLWSA